MQGSAEVLGADHQLILSSYLGGVDESAAASAPGPAVAAE
jgi:hypothetical protein